MLWNAMSIYDESYGNKKQAAICLIALIRSFLFSIWKMEFFDCQIQQGRWDADGPDLRHRRAGPLRAPAHDAWGPRIFLQNVVFQDFFVLLILSRSSHSSFPLQVGHVHSFFGHFGLHPLQCAIHGLAMFGHVWPDDGQHCQPVAGCSFCCFSVEDPGYLLGELEIQWVPDWEFIQKMSPWCTYCTRYRKMSLNNWTGPMRRSWILVVVLASMQHCHLAFPIIFNSQAQELPLTVASRLRCFLRVLDAQDLP